MSKYIVLSTDKFEKDVMTLVDHNILKNYSNNINDFAKKMIAAKNLQNGDVIYELKPILRVETQVVATRIKSL